MSIASLLSPLLLALQQSPAPTVVPPSSDSLPAAEWNDNRVPAGKVRDGVLTLRLVAQWSSWTLNTEKARHLPMLAFAEEGGKPTTPGPVLRVSLGTRVRVTVRNTIAGSTLIVRGLSARQTANADSLVIAPGATAEHEFIADAEGTHFYWGTISGAKTPVTRFGYDSQLNGAYVVDARTASRRPSDRIFLITLWSDSTNAKGTWRFDREFWAINGRAWPQTERLEYTRGDSIQWRVINASSDTHPMHLHGFYYRVDSRGTSAHDTIYATGDRRMVVTEKLTPGTTMRLAWSPNRDGGWIFHCHMTVHLEPQPPLAGQPAPVENHDPSAHTMNGMTGLILAINVKPPRGDRARAPNVAWRQLRLFVNSDSTPADSARRFGFVLQEGDQEPARDSTVTPGSPIVLHRDEPTEITVVNRLDSPTSIHWHGIELESFYDGVVGVGSMPGSLTPAVLPSDSFHVRMTPPRAGTFMYHTHFDDVYQQKGGLYGPIIILEPGERWDRERDLVFMIANDDAYDVVLNGSRKPAPLTLKAGNKYRLRIANITVANANLVMHLVRGGDPVPWRALAKDGFNLPEGQATMRPGRQPISNGEIYDFEYGPDQPGDVTFEIRSGGGTLLVAMPIHVVP